MKETETAEKTAKSNTTAKLKSEAQSPMTLIVVKNDGDKLHVDLGISDERYEIIDKAVADALQGQTIADDVAETMLEISKVTQTKEELAYAMLNLGLVADSMLNNDEDDDDIQHHHHMHHHTHEIKMSEPTPEQIRDAFREKEAEDEKRSSRKRNALIIRGSGRLEDFIRHIMKDEENKDVRNFFKSILEDRS